MEPCILHPEHVSVRGVFFSEKVKYVMKIVHNCNIVVQSNSHTAIKYAADELSLYIQKIIPACNVNICENAEYLQSPKIFLEVLSPLVYNGVSYKNPSSAFHIYEKDGNLYIIGCSEGSLIYAAYEFLENIGCRFFSPDTEKIPVLDSIEIESGFDTFESSPFEYRDIYWSCAFDTAWSLKARLNGACKNGRGMGRNLPESLGGGLNYAGPYFVHSFSMLVPPSEYFDTHPEYFSEIDGVRTAKHLYSQLCMTNKDVISISAKKACEWLRENPDRKMVSVSQNDSFVIDSYCQCDECKKIIEREGAPSGALIHFVNEVAKEIEKEFPDAIVDTLAYQYSVKPPKYIRPHKNVCIRLCTGGCNSHTIESCEMNAHIKEAFEMWSRICQKLYVWDYTTNFGQYLTPYPNLTIIPQNIKFFKDHSVKGLFMQGQYDGGRNGEFGELRSYIISRLLWNPNADFRSDAMQFISEYYGGAAPYVADYLKFIHEKGEKIHLGCAFLCRDKWSALISDSEVEYLDNLWDSAISACCDEKTRNHTARSSMCHEWFKLDSERIKNPTEENLASAWAEFYKRCKELGIERLSEGSNIPSPEINKI